MNEKLRLCKTIAELDINCRGNYFTDTDTKRQYEENGGTLEANEFFQMLRELERDGFIDRQDRGFYVK